MKSASFSNCSDRIDSHSICGNYDKSSKLNLDKRRCYISFYLMNDYPVYLVTRGGALGEGALFRYSIAKIAYKLVWNAQKSPEKLAIIWLSRTIQHNPDVFPLTLNSAPPLEKSCIRPWLWDVARRRERTISQLIAKLIQTLLICQTWNQKCSLVKYKSLTQFKSFQILDLLPQIH